jgi:hypothetical protein
MNLAICIASRGLVHSRTIESVLKNIYGAKFATKFFFTHDLPIPDAQNKLVEDALEWGADYLWFVEEDMLIPLSTFQKFFPMKSLVMAVDYPVGEKKYSCIARKQGEILWTGIGCTLFKSEVFEIIPPPWFEADKTVRITNEDPFEYVIDENVPYKYGGHDILFGLKCKEKGVVITQLEGITAGHIKPKSSGKSGYNDGIHEFEVWDKIENFQNYN